MPDPPLSDWRWATVTDGLGSDADVAHLVGGSMLSEQNLLPVMALREGALQHNIDVMAGWCVSHGAQIAPHAKTTMSQEIIARQMAAGAWGMTAATITQVRTLLHFGTRRIVLANTLANPRAIEWLAHHASGDPALEVMVFADSLEAVRLLDRYSTAGSGGGLLCVLVELGLPQRRTGARHEAQAMAVARAVSVSSRLRLAGVSAYEGVVATDREPATLDEVRRLCAAATSVITRVGEEGLFDGSEPVLTVGGSAYLDVVSAHCRAQLPSGHRPRLIVRSGCYVTHDHGLYQRLSAPMPDGGLQPALELWAQVISVPEPGLFVVGAGRRECPDDSGGPVLLRCFRAGAPCDLGEPVLHRLFDHHAVFQTTAAAPRVGDLVVLGVQPMAHAAAVGRPRPCHRDSAQLRVGTMRVLVRDPALDVAGQLLLDRCQVTLHDQVEESCMGGGDVRQPRERLMVDDPEQAQPRLPAPPDVQQDGVATLLVQQSVHCKMGVDARRLVAVPRHFVQRGHAGTQLPGVPGLQRGQREPHGKRLHALADDGHLAHLIRGHRGDHAPLEGSSLHETLVFEQPQCLSQRCATDAELGRQVHLAQGGGGRQLTGQDGAAKGVSDALGHRALSERTHTHPSPPTS